MTPTDEAAREVEESRESYREWLSGPESFLAAISRHELPVGHSLRFGVKGDVDLADAGSAVTIAATDDGYGSRIRTLPPSSSSTLTPNANA